MLVGRTTSKERYEYMGIRREYIGTRLENMQSDTRHIQPNVCENYERCKYRF